MCEINKITSRVCEAEIASQLTTPLAANYSDMSGVVIKLDDDEEEDDDVAELLAADDGGGDSGDDRKSGGGLSRRLHKRATTLGGRRGSLAQILNTGCLFAVFFGWVSLLSSFDVHPKMDF